MLNQLSICSNCCEIYWKYTSFFINYPVKKQRKSAVVDRLWWILIHLAFVSEWHFSLDNAIRYHIYHTVVYCTITSLHFIFKYIYIVYIFQMHRIWECFEWFNAHIPLLKEILKHRIIWQKCGSMFPSFFK